MNKWRFTLHKRWFAYLGVAIIFALVCVGLSEWQFARKQVKAVEISRISANYDAAPVALAEALPALDAFNEDWRWRPVTVTGTYLPDNQLLVRNRPHSGSPGYEILTPLQLEDGTVFIVDRGWVPNGDSAEVPNFVPKAPSGLVTVTARLKNSEATIRGRGAGEGQVATVNLPEIAQTIDSPTFTGAYGLLASEDPAPTDARPAAAERPEEDPGPHLSYAIQWILFALMGFAFLAYAIREEYRRINSDDPEEQERAAKRAAKRASKRTDADIEDDILSEEDAKTPPRPGVHDPVTPANHPVIARNDAEEASR